MVALGVLPRILPDHCAIRNAATLFHHDARQAAVLTDVDIRQHDRVRNLRVRIDDHVREQQRATHQRTGDDIATRHHGIHRHATPELVIEYKLGRRQLFLVSPDRPVLVIQIKLGRDTDELHVRRPIRIHGSDVSPVALALVQGVPEWIGDHPVFVEN